MIELKLNDRDVRKRLSSALNNDEQAIRKALREALAKTGRKGRTTGIDQIYQYIKAKTATRGGIKKADVRKQVRYTAPNYRNLTAIIRFGSLLIPASRLAPQQTPAGVIVKTPKGQMLLAGAFIAPYAKGRGKGVFRRDSRGKRDRSRNPVKTVKRGKHAGKRYRSELPIRKQSVRVVNEVEFERNVFDAIDKRVTAEWDIELDRAITRQAKRLQLN